MRRVFKAAESFSKGDWLYGNRLGRAYRVHIERTRPGAFVRFWRNIILKEGIIGFAPRDIQKGERFQQAIMFPGDMVPLDGRR